MPGGAPKFLDAAVSRVDAVSSKRRGGRQRDTKQERERSSAIDHS